MVGWSYSINSDKECRQAAKHVHGWRRTWDAFRSDDSRANGGLDGNSELLPGHSRFEPVGQALSHPVRRIPMHNDCQWINLLLVDANI